MSCLQNGSPVPPELSFEALTPVSFLERSAAVFPNRTAVVDGDLRFTYAEFLERSQRLAGGLQPLAQGLPIAVLLPNTHVMLEAHHGVPWAGSPLVTVNTRLAPAEVAYILEHSGAAVLLHDPRYDGLVADTLDQMSAPPLGLRAGPGDGGDDERLLAGSTCRTSRPDDERDLLAINYTSGTTGRPKGVMYHHRGAYLQSVAMLEHTRMEASSAYLWSLPMFHCNGWCFPWAVTAAGATHVCLDKVDAAKIWRLVEQERVTHLCGAPTLLSTMLDTTHAIPLGGPSHHVPHRWRAPQSHTSGGRGPLADRRDAPVWPDREVRTGGPVRLEPRLGRP